MLRLVLRRNQENAYTHQDVMANVYAAWSPDGSMVIYARGAGDPYQLAVAIWNSVPSRVVSRDLPTAGDMCANIAHNSSGITWDSKSTWVYYAACTPKRPSTEIARVQVNKNGSSAAHELLTDGVLPEFKHKAYPAPSPSDRKFAFAAGLDDGSWQLFASDLPPRKVVPRPLLRANWGGSVKHFITYPQWRP